MLKLNDSGSDVTALQELLCKNGYEVAVSGEFDGDTDAAVRNFQRDHNLTVDGLVGNKTMECLRLIDNPLAALSITEADYQRAAAALNVPVAAIKAVKEVETGGRSGFVAEGKPTILFEGHVFWSQLKKAGKSPEKHKAGNADILYSKWTKAYYKSGLEEYTRLERAKKIHESAALCSASWGLFQIMGFNYTVCKCQSVEEFVEKMCTNEGAQLDLFVLFLKGNGWDKYLRALDWAGFARHYNGPAYADNQYDVKLRKAYAKYK